MLLAEGKYSKLLVEQHGYRVMKANLVDEVICLTTFKPTKVSIPMTCPKTRDEIAQFVENVCVPKVAGSTLTFTALQVWSL